jgi:hypothetical protein
VLQAHPPAPDFSLVVVICTSLSMNRNGDDDHGVESPATRGAESRIWFSTVPGRLPSECLIEGFQGPGSSNFM